MCSLWIWCFGNREIDIEIEINKFQKNCSALCWFVPSQEHVYKVLTYFCFHVIISWKTILKALSKHLGMPQEYANVKRLRNRNSSLPGTICVRKVCFKKAVHLQFGIAVTQIMPVAAIAVILEERVGWVDPGSRSGAYQSCSINSLLSWTGERERETITKSSWVEIMAGRNHSAIAITGTKNLEKYILFIKIKSE